MKHAGDNHEAIFHSVVHLLQEKLVAYQCGLETALVTITLDRHAKNVGSALQEREVMFHELVFRLAVDLQDSEWPPLAL